MGRREKIDNAASVIAFAMVTAALSGVKTEWKKMKRYTPDFPEMMRLCETNYSQLRRLLRVMMQPVKQ